MDSKSDNILAKWLAGTSTKEEKEVLKNTTGLDEMKSILDRLDNYGYPEMDEEALLKKVLSNREKQPTKIRQLFPLLLKSAAAVLVIGMLFWYFTDTRTTLLAKAGEHQNYTLPDLSEVTLNADSKILFTQDAWPKERILELQGEAYFKVQKGSTFKVETTVGDVQVLGTQFDVFSRNGIFQIICYEGKVQVSAGNNQLNEILTKGQAIRIEGKKYQRYAVEAQKASWLDGKLIYNESSLSEVFEELERQFSFGLDYTSVIGNKRFTGVVLLQNKQIALKTVCSAMGLKYEEKTKNIIRISKLE